jgi:hypothetical protein
MIGYTCVGTRHLDRAVAFHGADEGAPGPRGGSFYGAYFRDLDGNKLAAYCIVKDA